MPDPPAVAGPSGHEFEGKRNVFQAIEAAPGIHVREVVRRTGLAYGSVEYHLRRLEDAGLIEGREEGQLRVFFAKQFPAEERGLVAAARSGPVRRILVALLSLGELSHGALAHATELKPSNVTYHLRALTRRQIVKGRRDGRALFLSLTDVALVERVLIRHAPSFADPALDAYVAVWSQWRAPHAPDLSAPGARAAALGPPGGEGPEDGALAASHAKGPGEGPP